VTWKPLGHVLPTRLTPARLTLHWAAQLVSAAGTSLLPADSEYAHTNLVWDPKLGVLAGRRVGPEALRAALVFEGLELVVLDGERERASMRLAGHTVDQALGWLGGELGAAPGAMELPSHDMPSHPVSTGGVFSDASAEPRAELAMWFADASSAILDAVASEPEASPVRCWPHHFDVASLIVLDRNDPPESARTIGAGFLPGDGSYAQPYFYVTPWPYPDPARLPTLEAGADWHTEGWTGAVLTGDRIVSSPPEEQPRLVRRVLDEAVSACRELLAA